MKRLPLLASLLLCAALPLHAHAGNCAEVSVDGYKAPDYGCLSQQMGNDTNAAKAAKKNREAQGIAVEKTPAEQGRPGHPGGDQRAYGQYLRHLGEAAAALSCSNDRLSNTAPNVGGAQVSTQLCLNAVPPRQIELLW